MYEGLGEVLLFFAGLGIITFAGLIIAMIICITVFITGIILLCLSINEKGELKLNGINEARIKKIGRLSIWSLIITIFSCGGCVFIVFPILALVFANSNAKTALKAGNIVEAAKKADLALIMLIIGNIGILGSMVLCAIGGSISVFI